MKRSASVFFLLLVFSLRIFSQDALPRSIPEMQGVSSQSIINFLDSTAVDENEFHSFMFLRHGKVIAEGWWNPYRADLKHTMYSCSKSFTATAIGFAVKEGKLNVTDKVISFFPDQLPDTVGAFLRDLTVRDLLTMSVGQEPDPTRNIVMDTNWVRSFLALPIVHKPGTQFLYNSMATYMLSAIVQKVTGQRTFDYLTTRLFEPLGIQGIDWEVDPKGINTGGWGLRLKTEDMAKFGQLFLQEGRWKKKRILPKAWIKEASTSKILQHPEYSQEKRDSSDWEQGYCYQMWRCKNNAYRADGAFGQFIIVMPEQDAVIAITSETRHMQGILDNVWKHLLPGMQKKRMKPNDSLAQQLKVQLNSLVLPIPGNSNTSDQVEQISGKVFSVEPNDKRVRTISFEFNDEVCTMVITNDSTTQRIKFTPLRWNEGETERPGPYLLSSAPSALKGLPPFKVAGEYNWRDDNKLELVLRYVESPHTETITCQFEGDSLKFESKVSFNPNQVNVLNGTARP
ncbi:MAG: serine hydrolase [Chitinophagaceae bacterium]|nr:serine hydrolase [Chitinophagaceae bacterium]